MAKMKDSGVEWIGEIPEHWGVARLKSAFSFGKGLPITKENLKEQGREVISYGQIHAKNNTGTSINQGLIRFVDSIYLKTNKESLVQKGDFIFADTSEDLEGCGNCVYNDRYDTIFAGYHTIIFKSYTRSDNKYLAYLFLTDCWRSQIRRCVSGVKLFSISRKILNGVSILLPPTLEQHSIAAYLDKKCSLIDDILISTRASIEDYKKLRASTIYEAVTKGLNPDAKMKDSGVEWIGEIPKHWKTVRLKSVFSFGKGLPITKENLKEKGCEVISYGQIHAKNNTGTSINQKLIRFVDSSYLKTNQESLVQKGDFIFADTSEDLEGCGNCAYNDSHDTIFAGYHTIIFKSYTRSDNKYLAYLFLTDCWRSQIRSCVSGVKLFSISRKILSGVSILHPPALEQQSIAGYLDNRCAQIDELIAEKEALISDLEAYRKSLIYECVTGKRRVPGVADA